MTVPTSLTGGVLTVSDKGSRGMREDVSGREVLHLLEGMSVRVDAYEIIPDDKDMIKQKLIDYADHRKLDLIVTTGGTGVSPRDVTPDATLEVVDKLIPGMAEMMRLESMSKTPYAMISRAVVGIRNKSLIINLPGSPKGARENLSVLIPALRHAIEKIKGDETDCAQPLQ
ncbi:MAG: MogA/MoaB family molybdenum cofactor biosynthesis protein [Deltaproteobacteria bacterium]|nr:MogA/MoaB family molybdenum cofactor biosynthesis protein [Deltaproteobacteria bacterium]